MTNIFNYDKQSRDFEDCGPKKGSIPYCVKFEDNDKGIQFELPSAYAPSYFYTDKETKKKLYLILHANVGTRIPDNNDNDYFVVYHSPNRSENTMNLMKVKDFKYLRSKKKGILESLGVVYLSEITFVNDEGKERTILTKESKKFFDGKDEFTLIGDGKKIPLEDMLTHYIK
jgi:hypothetical protein